MSYDKCVAIVGNRSATIYAKQKAKEYSKLLVDKGYTIVSGLARGIDREAHLGALDSDYGNTISVLAWMNPIYPSKHKKLALDIEKRGAITSELYNQPRDYGNNRAYSRSRFIVRNRIISGLSNFIIAVESGASGGTIWQTELALLQNKPVYTFKPIDKTNKDKMNGYNRMIKMGAKTITNLSDLSKLYVYN